MSFTPMHLYFDDVSVGQEWRSLGRTITEADIVGFAGISGDFNPIHVDHAFAKTTAFGKPIAHGLLILAVASGLAINAPPMRTLAFLQIREWVFRLPVYIGDTIVVLTRVADKKERSRGRRGEIGWFRQVINQDGKVVMEGASLTLVDGRGRTPLPSGEKGEQATDA